MPIIELNKQLRFIKADSSNLEIETFDGEIANCSFWFDCDVLNTVASGCQQVRISVVEQTFRQTSKKLTSTFSTKESISTKTIKQQYNIDLTKKIPNNKTRVLSVKKTTNYERIETPNIVFSTNSTNQYIVLEVTDSLGNIYQTIELQIKPSKLLGFFLKPKIPPILDVYKTNQTCYVLMVTQKDPNGEGIVVYKQTPTEPPTRFKQFPAKFGHIEKLLDAAGAEVTYYAIAVGKDNVLGQNFSSWKFSNRLNHGIITSKAKLLTKLTDQGFVIEISDVNSKTEKLILKKTTKGGSSTIEDTFFLNKNSKTIEDKEVIDGYTYEYSLVELLNNGMKLQGPSIQDVYRKISVGKISVTVNDVIADSSNISFNISTTKTPSNLNLVRTTGSDSIFTSSLSTTTDVGMIFVHEIKRMTNDSIVYLGKFVDSRFDDIQASSLVGATPIKSNEKYRYRITTYMVDPSTILDGTTSTTPKNSIYQTKKWRNPYTAKTGILVSNESFLANHAIPMEFYGTVYSVIELDFQTPRKQSSIINLQLKKTGERSELSWLAQEPDGLVSFIIYEKLTNEAKVEIGKQFATEETKYNFILTNNTKHQIKSYLIEAYDFSGNVLASAEIGNQL